MRLPTLAPLTLLLLSCATGIGIKPVYTIQSTGLIKGDIAVKALPFEGMRGEGPDSLGATRLEGRVDDFLRSALLDELGAFGFTVTDGARLELTMAIQKAESTTRRQGEDEIIFTTAVELRFQIRDRLKENAIVYDRVHTGEVSHSQRYGGYPASASFVDAVAQAYGRFLSDSLFYDKLVKDYGYSKSAQPSAVAAAGPSPGDALELSSSSLTAFPILIKYYDDHPVGKATLRNRLGVLATNLRISLFVPSYMDSPKECGVIEALRDRADIDLFALFNGKILSVTEGEKAAATLSVEYALDGVRYTQAFPLTMRIVNRNAIVWDDDRKAASFVTALDPEVLSFAKNTTGLLSECRAGSIDKNILKAAILHEALAAYGLGYEVDPNSSYTTAKGTTALDFLQFPRQTLRYRSGDCDDLSILYCALLEAVGVETAFITEPGHIYMAFAAESAPERSPARSNYAGDFILKDGKYWAPVETTLVKEDFLRAWQTGKEEWSKSSAAGTASFYPMRESWKTYEAVDFDESSGAIALPDKASVLARLAATLDRYIERETGPAVGELKAEIAKAAGGAAGSAELTNKLALLYAKYGKLDLSLAEFMRAADSEDYLPAIVNAGNVRFIEKDYAGAKALYNRAYAKAPDNPALLLQLSRTLFELGDYAASEAMYKRLEMVNEGLAAQNGYLGKGGSGKAAERSDSPAWME